MTCESTPTTAATEPCAPDAATTSRAAGPIDRSTEGPSSTCEREPTPTVWSAPGNISPDSGTPRYRGKWTLQQVIRRLRELAIEGEAPSKDRWDQQRGPKMPSAYTIVAAGHPWAELVGQAGLRRSAAGNKVGSKKGFVERPVPEETEAFIRHAFETSEPPRPKTWPLFAVGLTRREEFVGRRPDGQYVRCVREYYSLR